MSRLRLNLALIRTTSSVVAAASSDPLYTFIQGDSDDAAPQSASLREQPMRTDGSDVPHPLLDVATPSLWEKNHLDWSDRDRTKLIALVQADLSAAAGQGVGSMEPEARRKSTKPARKAASVASFAPPAPLSLLDLAHLFKRDPVIVARFMMSIPETAIPGVGPAESDEAKDEFMGLTLGGVPIGLALRWCADPVACEHRPSWQAIQKHLTSDHRPALQLARSCGIWVSGVDEMRALQFLLDVDVSDVSEAIEIAIVRGHAVTPEVVFQALCGAYEHEQSIDWASIALETEIARSAVSKPSAWRSKQKRCKPSTSRCRAQTKKKPVDPWSVDPVFTHKKAERIKKASSRSSTKRRTWGSKGGKRWWAKKSKASTFHAL